MHVRLNMCGTAFAPVAQLDRALACGAKGHKFESCRVYHEIIIYSIRASNMEVLSLEGGFIVVIILHHYT
jgi:hypothetical protein